MADRAKPNQNIAACFKQHYHFDLYHAIYIPLHYFAWINLKQTNKKRYNEPEAVFFIIDSSTILLIKGVCVHFMFA